MCGYVPMDVLVTLPCTLGPPLERILFSVQLTELTTSPAIGNIFTHLFIYSIHFSWGGGEGEVWRETSFGNHRMI